jgi:hypothetical protein
LKSKSQNDNQNWRQRQEEKTKKAIVKYTFSLSLYLRRANTKYIMTTLRYSGGANINDGSGGRGGGGGGRGHFTGKNAARGRGRGVSSGSSNNRSYTRWARATAPVDDSAAATGGGAALASHSWIRPKAKDESPTSSGSTTNYGNAAHNPAAAVASTSSAVVHEQHQLATNHNNSNDINNRLDSKQQSEDAAITKSAPRSQQQSTPFPAPLTSIGGTVDDSEKNRLLSSSMETTTTATTLAPPEKAATDKQDIDATVGEITATATTATTGPILKGPKKYSYIKPSSSQSAPTSSSSYSRKRGLTAGAAGQLAPNLHQHHSGTSTGTSSNIRQVGAKRASPHSNNINSSSNSFSWKRAEGKSSSTAAAAPTSTEHVAIAASSKKPPPPPPPAGAVPAFSQELAGQQLQQDSTTAQIAHDKASATNPLRKVGAYKLVHKKDNEETHNTVRKTSPTQRTAGLDNGSSSSNSRSYHRKKPPPPPPHHSTLQQQKRAAAVAAAASIRGAKRIKITSAAVPVGTDGTAAAAVEEEEEQRQAENDGEGVGGDDNDTHTRQERKGKSFEVEKTLTDFAYASSRRVVSSAPAGHGRRHKRSHRHGPTTSANNTLVRLQPDVATTPICPTFLRGLQCTEERCLQRHDIPKEFGTYEK